MAQITLRRFKTLDIYNSKKEDGVIKDGDFFIIDSTQQFGTNYKGNYILSPSNILYDYKLPEGEVIITTSDTISEAFNKLESYIKDSNKNIAKVDIKAQTALDTLSELGSLENVSDVETYILTTRREDIVMSESEFDSLDVIKQNAIYYIYEDD